MTSGSGANLVALGNHGEGASRILTAALGKRYDTGFDLQVSYAWQDVEAVTEGFSSRGISNWRGIADADRNRPSARTSPYQVTHSVKLNAGYERAFGQGFRVRADVFGRAWSGDRFTYTFDVDRGNALFGRAGAGESPYDNSPLYVPARGGDPTVAYGAGFDREAFFAYLDANEIESGIHAPYSADAGMNQVWDLRVRLELPGIPAVNRWVGENHASLVLDVENVLNLLNDRLGHLRRRTPIRAGRDRSCGSRLGCGSLGSQHRRRPGAYRRRATNDLPAAGRLRLPVQQFPRRRFDVSHGIPVGLPDPVRHPYRSLVAVHAICRDVATGTWI